MTPCRHLLTADEAYTINDDGSIELAHVSLCEWPDQHPHTFIGAPNWLLRLIGPGLSITPERDCVGCPGYARS